MKKDKDRDSIAKIFFSAEYARAERSAPEEIIKLNSKLKDHPVYSCFAEQHSRYYHDTQQVQADSNSK